MKEVERIKKAYKKRDTEGKSRLYSLIRKDALYTYHQREKALLETLASCGIQDLDSLRILDVGCGNGGVLRDFLRYGARPDRLYGIDLLEDRIAKAQELSPNIDFRVGNAEKLPYPDGFFDLVLCFTLFSSILDPSMRENVAREILRVLRKGGLILWYDYHVDNPFNPDVKGVRRKEIQRLFPGCKVKLKRITLAPPLTRRLIKISPLLCYLLEKLKILNTHYLGTIHKP